MPCQCDERKQELVSRGIHPLIGDAYTPIDFGQWAVTRVMEKLFGGR